MDRGLEEQFYLLWPPAFGLLAVRRRLISAGLLLGLGLTSLVGHGPIFGLPVTEGVLNFNPVWKGGGSLFGCAMALTQDRWAKAARSPLAGIVGVALLGLAIVVASGPHHVASWATLVATVAAAVLIGNIVSGQNFLHRVLALRPAVWVGKISYEIYLWHFPLMLLAPLVLTTLPVGVAKLVSVPVAVAASAASHYWVSLPLNTRFKARLAAREGTPSPIPL